VFFSLGVENRGEGTLDEADQAYQLSAIGIPHVSVDLSIFLVLLYFYIPFNNKERIFQFYVFQHGFIRFFSYSTVSEDDVFEQRTVVTLALAVRCSNNLPISHQRLG
jgi:hypothetical protein